MKTKLLATVMAIVISMSMSFIVNGHEDDTHAIKAHDELENEFSGGYSTKLKSCQVQFKD